ncbi:MAG: hypothetical protein ACI87J_002090 [Colwellia sp.]|jgi:hypothetical protein
MFLVNPQKPEAIAKIAGFLYLLLIPLGVYGILYIPNILVVEGDIKATIHNMNIHNLSFRISVFVAFVTQLVNVFLVLYLYKLLHPVSQSNAVLMVIFSLLAVPIAMFNELNYIAIIILNDLSDQALINNLEQIFFTQLFIELHQNGIMIAQIFWGLWLLPMGLLIINSEFIPKALGILMLVAGIGYLIDVFTWFIFPSFEVEFSAFTFWGEILLPLWLVIKGVELSNWRRSHFP